MTLNEAILAVLRDHPEGLSRAELQRLARRQSVPAWTFRRALQNLASRGLVEQRGQTRARRYVLAPARALSDPNLAPAPQPGWAFSRAGADAVARVTRPLHQRQPCSYERGLLDSYVPNRTPYLTPEERVALRQLGSTPDARQPAGTWARHILERLLVDLSWNSSRLEGNTYSLLDTERLFQQSQGVEGHQLREAQMLLNHKQAIEFLVGEGPALRLEPRTVRTLHAMLAENLLPDPAEEGQLRTRPVAISESVYMPLEVPQRIEELFVEVLARASAVADPFEQSLFLLVHLPYLQPFSDANKRTARLAANIPFVQQNLQPLSFVDLPREAYTLATLAVYEERRVEPMRDVFLWAYRRSAERYRALAQAMGEPDAFRLRYRLQLRELVRTVVQERPEAAGLERRVADLAEARAPAEDRPRLVALALTELRHLNDVTYPRYQLTPSDFARWRKKFPG